MPQGTLFRHTRRCCPLDKMSAVLLPDPSRQSHSVSRVSQSSALPCHVTRPAMSCQSPTQLRSSFPLQPPSDSQSRTRSPITTAINHRVNSLMPPIRLNPQHPYPRVFAASFRSIMGRSLWLIGGAWQSTDGHSREASKKQQFIKSSSLTTSCPTPGPTLLAINPRPDASTHQPSSHPPTRRCPHPQAPPTSPNMQAHQSQYRLVIIQQLKSLSAISPESGATCFHAVRRGDVSHQK